MRSIVPPSCIAALSALTLLLGAPPAAAQDPEDDEMERIAATYRLTEPVLKKYSAAMRELLTLARKDPSVLQTDDDTGKMVHPAVRAIYARVGLSVDEAEKFAITLVHAQMTILAADLSAEGARQLGNAPPVVGANVAFVRAHDAEVKAVGSDLRQLERIRDGEADDAEAASDLKVTGAARAGANSEIELEVTGGPRAGRYTAKVTEGGCSSGLAREGAWGMQYSITTGDVTKFSSLQLIVPDAKAAAAGTQSFVLTVSFGPLVALTGPRGTHYTVKHDDAGGAEGRGTVKVSDSGAGATVTFDAKTKDDVGLKGTIRCHSVVRAG